MIILSKVNSTSIVHSKKASNPSEEVALEKDGCTRPSSLTLYVPTKINIDEILEQHPPDFKYHKDHFVYILHLITSLHSKKRDNIDDYDGFTPINGQVLQRRNHEYKKYLKYLLDRNIIICDWFYIPKKKSYGYKISDRYQSEIRVVKITKKTLIKSIINNRDYNREKTEELLFLKKWFNSSLKIDIVSAKKYLKTEYIKDKKIKSQKTKSTPEIKYNARLLPILNTHTQNHNFHVDNKGYRLHTNLTQTKTELRKFISYEGKKLCAVDIKNSQPFLSIALLDKNIFINNNIQDKIINPNLINNNSIMLVDLINEIEKKPDVIEFKKMVGSGEFYEQFGEILIDERIVEVDDNCNIRAMAKDITFSTFFSPNTSITYNNAMKVFKAKFPNVYRVFKLIKTGREKHNSLAIALQRLEAELVLDRACKIINRLKPNIPLYTLHDSIITTEENVDFIELIMSKVLKKQIGIKPNLKIEPWT